MPLTLLPHPDNPSMAVDRVSAEVRTLAGGALANYILEHIPDDDRPAHLAWYNMALNVAILFGSLVGPFVAHKVGLVTALAGIALLRLGSAVAIWRWGNGRTRSD